MKLNTHRSFQRLLTCFRLMMCFALLLAATVYSRIKQWQKPLGDGPVAGYLDWNLRLQSWAFVFPLVLAAILFFFRFSKVKILILSELLTFFGLFWFVWTILCWEVQAIPEIR